MQRNSAQRDAGTAIDQADATADTVPIRGHAPVVNGQRQGGLVSAHATHFARILVLPVTLLALAATVAAPDITALTRTTSTLFAAPVGEVLPPGPGDVAALRAPLFALAKTETAAPRLTALTAPAERPSEAPAAVDLPPAQKPRGALITSMYVSFAALQGLDVHSTLLAVDRGAREGNPMMATLVDHPAAFVAFKAGTAAGVLLLTDHIRRHNRLASIVIMTAANSAYAIVVANNYRLAARLEH